MQHKRMVSERGVVHYRVSAGGGKRRKTLVFTHGLTANNTMFEKQFEFFAKDFNIIAWDVPLHGLSRPYKDFSYENCARELRAVLDAESIEKAVLIGMSMGGYPSQMFACMYPQRTEGFIALDTTPFGLEYYSGSDIWWLMRAARIAKWFPDGMLRKSMAKSVSFTRYSYECMMRMLKPLTKAEIIDQMDIAYAGFIKENRDVSFSFPVCILLGEHDRTGSIPFFQRRQSRAGKFGDTAVPAAALGVPGPPPGLSPVKPPVSSRLSRRLPRASRHARRGAIDRQAACLLLFRRLHGLYDLRDVVSEQRYVLVCDLPQ